MTHLDIPRLQDIRHAHFLGIGGVGVSGVARILLARGITVTGTDAKDLPVMQQLRERGATIYVGYEAENFHRAQIQTNSSIDIVVASTVAGADNPERQAAEAAGVPIYHRSQGLAAAMDEKQVLTVAGTHGKTTTSSMAAVAFTYAGAQPSFAVGAAIANLGTNAEHGSGDWFIAEADESDGSLLNYTPNISIITNIEADHLDYYGTEAAVHQVFADFATQIRPDGALVVCADDEGAASLAQRHRDQGTRSPKATVYTYGLAPSMHPMESTNTHAHALDLAITDIQPDVTGSGQQVTYQFSDGRSETIALATPGTHNALNAAGVLLASVLAGIPAADAAAGLASFTGSARRFEHHGTVNDIRVYDDYAHHPTEVHAAITAANSMAAGNKVHVIFQPHLFSRTRDFAPEFAAALSLASTVRVLDIYPARETPLEGVTAELITGQLAHDISTRYPQSTQVASRQAAVKSVVQAATPGDIVLTLGAGDVNQLIEAIFAGLNESNT
ncbi:MAG TPA: UDP-N-acetylmuramate--L-alanine ligase [Candidatus Yaniella excrementavium]|nr:UDP-N-acetylmuramate--L-alanine ligase [Candidatus Yaniella excrementavium]